MAKEKNSGSLEVVSVEHPGGEDQPADFLRKQDSALLHYKATGVNSLGYVDPSRDQEPDIAPEKGLAPHPEMFNPAPPPNAEGAVALDPKRNPIVASPEDKAKAAEDSQANAQAVADARNEAGAVNPDGSVDEDAESPELSAEDAINLKLAPDGSPKASQSAGQ